MVRRLAVAALWLAALCVTGPCTGQAIAATPRPLIPRSEMLAVDDLRPGMKGVGKSVFRATTVEEFGITVLGVLRKVDFDGDIILVRIDSGPPVSQGFGVVAGMSGSPIYINGKLVGALAYAWPFAKTPIAGVTPIAQMLEAFEPGSAPVRPQGALRATEPFVLDGERIERAVVAASPSVAPTGGQGTLTLVPVATPVLVTGMSESLLGGLRRALEPLGLVPLAGAGSAGHIDTAMRPGQAVGARLVGGDLDVTAIGTVTYVRDDVVLAFGHPMASLGSADLPMVAAYVHGVLPSAQISFKLASGGQAIGSFTEDRPGCVGGRLGASAQLIESELRVRDRERGVVREYRVEVIRNRSLTSLLLVAVLSMAVESVGPPAEGTTRVRFRLEADGLPALERENTYTVDGGDGLLMLLLGALGGADSATGELSQILDVLQRSEFGEARLSRVSTEVELSKARRLARLEDVTIPTPVVRAGEEISLAITIRTSDGGIVHRTETIRIPGNCPPGRVRVGVAGGRSAERVRARLQISEPRPASLAQMVEQMLRRPSNDDLVIALALPTVGIEARGFAFRDLPPAVVELLRSATSKQLRPLRDSVEQRRRTEWVISGTALLTLTVEGEEKDKAGRPPSPEYEPPRYQQGAGGFADLLFGSELEAARARMRGRLDDGIGLGLAPEVDAPPTMPSWDEVASVGEGGEEAGPERKTTRAGDPRGDAVGRVASAWRVTDPKELPRGTARGAMLLSAGGIALAPETRELARVEARMLWPVAVDSDGSVYSGSWTDGRVRRTDPDGQTEIVLDTDRAGIQAICAALGRGVYAAAVPGGAIYRIAPGEVPVLVCELGVQNVWAMAVTSDGDLWAATGPDGGLYRVTPEGAPSLAFRAADRHVNCLAVAPGDPSPEETGGADYTVFVGTSPLGKVYGVGRDGRARALYEVERAAVQSIAVDSVGAVYVGTSPEARVIRIAPSGAVTEAWKGKGKHVLALLARPDGSVLAAVGPGAKVYAVHPDEDSALVWDSKATFISAMATDAAGDVYLSAADTGRLVKLQSSDHRSGSYLSGSHSAGSVARWGAVRWRGRTPEGASIEMAARTGATAYPDETWSPWQNVPLRPGASVASPPGRFLQCRIDLRSSGPAAPRLDWLEIAYLPANRAPELKLASPAAGAVWSGKQTVRWRGRDPDGDPVDYSVFWSSDGGETWTKIEAPQKGKAEGEDDGEDEESDEGEEQRGVGETAPPQKEARVRGRPAAGAARKRAVAGGDEFALSEVDIEDLMALEEEMVGDDLEGDEDGEGEEPGDEAAVGFRATSLRWDTASVGDGEYWIKVRGSDARSNPGDPEQVEVIVGPVVVDNTGPEIILDRRRKEGDPLPASVAAFDRGSHITSAEFRVDGGEWQAALAADGIFDGQYEVIVLDPARVPAGSHSLEVRVRDAAGNAVTETLRYRR